MKTDGCGGTPSEVNYLEHFELTLSLGFPRRGDLKKIVVSPSGSVYAWKYGILWGKGLKGLLENGLMLPPLGEQWSTIGMVKIMCAERQGGSNRVALA